MTKYPWFRMPGTIHKVLIHPKQVLKNSALPAGYFGEEASEARNKFYKRDRELHERKNSRINNLEDIFNRAIAPKAPAQITLTLRSYRHVVAATSINSFANICNK